MPIPHFDNVNLAPGVGNKQKLTVTGTLASDSDSTVAFHWELLQEGVTVGGRAKPNRGSWSDTVEDAPRELHKGDAIALGVAVAFREEPRPDFETFTWIEQVEVN